MCYGYGNWFGKARAKELGKAQEKVDALNKERASSTPATPVKEQAKPVEEREKVPA